MSDSIDSLNRENSNLKQQLNVVLQKLAIYEDEDLERDGYFALKFWIKQQIDIVKDFKLKDEITKNPKDDKFYDRVKALGEGLKSMITDLKVLRADLGITLKDEKEAGVRGKLKNISPESIADHVGELAGKSSN